MELQILSHISDELDSLEVAALCFLCRDVISRKSLEGITDARELFRKLDEKALMDNSSFLSQLLQTIGRADLLTCLKADGRQPEETDARPLLSGYRVMLYKLYEGLGKDDLAKMKFLLSDKLERRPLDMCNTALDVFAEMEKKGLLSPTKLDELQEVLQEVNRNLALNIQPQHSRGFDQLPGPRSPPAVSMDTQPAEVPLSLPETQSRDVEENLFSDADPTVGPTPPLDDIEYYTLVHNPRGLCVIFNNENFTYLTKRAGTMEDERSLRKVFTRFGFKVVVHTDLTADAIQEELMRLGKRNFGRDDAMVVVLLSHGEKGCVFGTDGERVPLQDITEPFTSRRAPTLAGKPKLFFIQACQGDRLQQGRVPCSLKPALEGGDESQLEEDAGLVRVDTVPDCADFLLGMATVQDYKSFRNVTSGSIYIQELCLQLTNSAESPRPDDILSILTRVNREVSSGMFLRSKQMPEPKYTLTRKLVLTYV